MCIVPLISTLATHKHCLSVCALVCVSAYVCAHVIDPSYPHAVPMYMCTRVCISVYVCVRMSSCMLRPFSIFATMCLFKARVYVITCLQVNVYLYGWVCNKGMFISNYSPSTQSCIPCPQLSTVTSPQAHSRRINSPSTLSKAICAHLSA